MHQHSAIFGTGLFPAICHVIEKFDRVQISRNEHGDLVIHPIPAERGQALLQALQALGEVDEQFIAALEAEQEDSQPMQDREAL